MVSNTQLKHKHYPVRKLFDFIHHIAGNDLSSRLKTLEEENAALKRQQHELNIQILEHEQNQLMRKFIL